MYQFFVEPHQISDKSVRIEGQDVNHIKNVLRLNIDDDLQICDLDTTINYTCGISRIDNDKIEFSALLILISFVLGFIIPDFYCLFNKI